MSIAISLKVNDGVVLAADSAATLTLPKGGVAYVYNNANKLINLYKGLPIGVLTWGNASIGNDSIQLILKELRDQLKEDDKFDSENYTIEQAATRLREFVLEKYKKYASALTGKPVNVGFLVCGFGSNGPRAEEYFVEIRDGKCTKPGLVRDKNDIGISWKGEGEALFRLLKGYKPELQHLLMEMKEKEEIGAQAYEKITKKLNPTPRDYLITPAMPLQDAIELAEFLVQLSAVYSKYSLGAPTVGGPIEIAAITRYEGFKWVKRKHYFSSELNP